MGGRFAKQFPRVAKRLELDGGPSPDPHVERLIESVAFLTAKLQNHLEGELPEITSGLLGYLYPHFTQPVPSMAITEIVPDDGGAGWTSGVDIPAGTRLYQQTTFQRRTCWFKSCYPVTLWPVSLIEAKFEPPSTYGFLTGRDYLNVRQVLRLKIKGNSEPLHTLGLDKLRIYLDGDDAVVGGLFELLLSHTQAVACIGDYSQAVGRGHKPPEATVRPVGFNADEIILPVQDHALKGFSLLQEYFGFPQKFLFFDIEGIVTDGAVYELDLLFLFDQVPRRRMSIRPDNFRLGCTPVINLFEKVSEPIQITGRNFEYLVQPDSREERVTEIHTIKAITPSLTLSNDDPVIEPLYGGRHDADPETVYWMSTRRPARNPTMPGTDVSVSFLDMRMEPTLPQEETYRAHLLCTNRELATYLDRGDTVNIEDGPHAKATLLTRPTKQVTPPLQGESLWRLVSLLALSHTGLPEHDSTTVEALREMLRVYGFTSAESIEPQLQAMTKVSRETVAMRADDQAWRGFVRVQRITIEVDEERFDGPTALLLGQVLHSYFGLHSSINVFTQLVMLSRQREGTWKQWPPNIPTTGR